MNTKNKIIKNTFHSSISIYTEYLLGLVCSIIIARSLGSTDYGIYALYIWIAASSIFLINGGLNVVQIKYVAELKHTKGIDHAKAAVDYFKKIQLWKAIVIIFIAICLHRVILDLLNITEHAHLFWAVLAAIIFRVRYMFYVSCAKGLEDFHKLSTLALIVTPINLILVVLAAAFSSHLNYFIYVYLITGVLFFFISRHLIWNSLNNSSSIKLDEEYKLRINNYLKITTITAIIGYFVSKGFELFMLGWLSTPEQVGMFRIGLLLAGSIMLLIPGVFSAVLLPNMSKSYAISNTLAGRRYYDSTRFLIILSIPVVALITYISKDMIKIVYGHEFLEASIALNICIISVAISTISDSAQSYLLSSEKQVIILIILSISLILKLLFGYYLISNYDLFGASLTFLLTNSIASISKIYLACRYTHTTFPFISLIKSLLGSILCLVLLHYLININNIYISIITSCSLFVLLYIFTTFVIKIWSQEDITLLELLVSKIKYSGLRIVLTKVLTYAR